MRNENTKGKKFNNKRKPGYSSKELKRKAMSEEEAPNVTQRRCVSADNDPKWYSLNDQLLKDVASYPYAWPLGRSLDVGQYGSDMNKGSLPGIFTMNWIPTIGNSPDATSAINVATINTYTKIRHDNSGHANYDHQDYGMYLIAMDSIYAFHSWMRRCYGVALTYSNTNRYYPSAVIKSMGVDFKDLQARLADFRAYINAYAVKASALAVPAKMSYMAKHYWMSSGLYFDSNQDKPQTYLFNPLGFYQFTLKAGEAPYGTCEFKALFGEKAVDHSSNRIPKDPTEVQLSVDAIMKYGDELLNPIIADEDFGIMSGDTLKSFTPGGCFTLPVTPEDYTVVPSYSEEVLDQIQNATLIGDVLVESATIDQDVSIGTGAIICSPKFYHPWVDALPSSELPGQNAFLVDRIVTFMHGDIAPANTMEATRWTNVGTQVTEKNTREYSVPTLGSEAMCHGFITYYANPSTAEAGQMVPMFSDPIYVSMNIDFLETWTTVGELSDDLLNQFASSYTDKLVTKIQRMMLTIQQLSAFDRHPPVYVTSYQGLLLTLQSQGKSFSGSGQKYGHINGVLSDVNYYTVLNARDLENLSHIALLSEFDVTMR